MRFRRKAHLIAGLLFLNSWYLVAGKTINQDTREITILVFNNAGVSSVELSQAEAQATLLFHKSGITTSWIECSDSNTAQICHRAVEPNEFVVHIVPRGQTSTDTIFGLAFLGPNGTGNYSDIFYERIEQMHRDSGVNPARLLAAVAVHEVGHLLLGSNSHSGRGIMSAHWKQDELRLIGMGCLIFVPEQGTRMRARIEDGQREAKLASGSHQENAVRRLSLAAGQLY
jgi:hypothetical protein